MLQSKNNIFKWNFKDILQVVLGIMLLAFAINVFIVPNSLYNGGVLGISQLIRSFLENYFSFPFDIAGLINLGFNIPLFLIAYKFVSKPFFFRTVFCIVVQTIFLTFIPIPEQAIVPEMITSVLIGAILGGIGGGMVLSSGGSGGGTDIIGFVVSMRNKKFTVGRISRAINVIIYAICGILYGLPTMIYSIIYSFVSSLVADHSHKQNVCTYVMIFTKDKPTKIISFIKDVLHRDCTFWEATGGYDSSRTYISYSAMSKYEMQILEHHIHELSPDAFVVRNEGIHIDGNFKKNLVDLEK